VTTQPDAFTQAEYWNGEEAQHWLAYQDRYEAMLGPFTRHVMSALDLAVDDAVLDVGCGCGAATLAAARIVTQNTAQYVPLPSLETSGAPGPSRLPIAISSSRSSRTPASPTFRWSPEPNGAAAWLVTAQRPVARS
jgi:hypothetical protein